MYPVPSNAHKFADQVDFCKAKLFTFCFQYLLLQSSEDAVILQKLLYDAVILVDHSFLSSGRWFQIPESSFRNLVLLWSLIVDNAIQFAR